jgi:hypothetical protein
MEHSVGPTFPARADSEAGRMGNPPDHVRADADAEATNKQRRKVQNRKNQRARRQYFPQYLIPYLTDTSSRTEDEGARP